MNTITTNYDIVSLYNLIKDNDSKETFRANLDKWTAFYNNRHQYIKNNILDERLYELVIFLLENEKGEIFDYFASELISILYKEEGNTIFSYRDKLPPHPNNINNLFKILTNHDNLNRRLNELTLEDTFGDLKTYQSKQIELYMLDSLIMNIYQTFFELEPSTVKESLKFITKNSCLLQKDDVKKQLMNTDLIYQYQDKIIPIEIFLGQDITEDRFMEEIITYQIRDKKVVFNLFKKLPISSTLELFDYNLKNMINFIEHAPYLTNEDKQTLIYQLLNKIEEKDYDLLLELIAEKYQNSIWECYLTNERKEKIINWARNQNPLYLRNDESIKFLIKNDYTNINFIKNTLILLQQDNIKKKENFDVEGIFKEVESYIDNKFPDLKTKSKNTIINPTDSLQQKHQKSKLYELYGRRLDFNTCIELLKGYFENEINLDRASATTIIRSLATYFLDTLNIENNGVYFYHNQESMGEYNPTLKTIGINLIRVEDFINKNKSTYDQLKVLSTMFHEIKHAEVDKNRNNNSWNFEEYEMEKENIMRAYDEVFYATNYLNIKEEIAARIEGVNSLFKFIENFFPNLLDKIQDEIIANLEEENKRSNEHLEDHKMKFLKEIELSFNRGFDTLMKYNTNIIKKHPILAIEYYPNGLPKNYEDIYSERTEENKHLIDKILNNRYPQIDEYQKKNIK